jgi:anti-sigma factor RsiW
VTAAHLDYEALADFAEGILDDATATSTEEHLAHCGDCRRRAAEVAEVSRVLARAPTPPMPAHLVARLDAALAAEAAAHAPAQRHHRRFQLVAAAAAAVVVVGGGAAAVRTAIDSGGPTGAAKSQSRAADPSHSVGKPGPAVVVPFTPVRSGTKYTSARLDAQVAGALAKPPAAQPRALDATGGPLGPCVTRVGGGSTPLLVDSATYEGRAATVIAFPGADAAHVDVWVVGDRCSTSVPDVITHRQISR